jgi:hypothetical protein
VLSVLQCAPRIDRSPFPPVVTVAQLIAEHNTLILAGSGCHGTVAEPRSERGSDRDDGSAPQ